MPVSVVSRVGFLEKGLHGRNEFTRLSRRQVAGTACAKAWKQEHARLGGASILASLGGSECSVCGRGRNRMPFSLVCHGSW